MFCSQHRSPLLSLSALALGATLLGFGCDGATATDAGVDAAGLDAALPPGPRPDKRSDFLSVADPVTNQILMFGGDDGPIVNQIPRAAYRDDTWLFTPGVGWRQVEGAAPSARGRYGAAYDAANGRAIVFGGRFRVTGGSGDYTLYNDLWAFDFETETWTQLDDGAGAGPAPRFFAGVGVDPDDGTIYVAGGGLNANALAPAPASDLWAFDGSSWSEVTTSGVAPSPRLFMTWGFDPTRGRLFAFAGQAGDFVSASYTDFYALDVSSGEWTVLHDGISGTYPRGRFNGMGAYDAAGDRYLVFGGHSDSIMLNDVWAFDPNGGGWSALAMGDTPGPGGIGCLSNPSELPQDFVNQDLSAPQGRQTSGFVVLDGAAYTVFGESDCSDHLDDVWRFDLSADTWGEVLEARAGESCARRGDDCMCLCL